MCVKSALIDDRYEHEPGKYLLLLDMCREFINDSKLIVWTGFVDNADWPQIALRSSTLSACTGTCRSTNAIAPSSPLPSPQAEFSSQHQERQGGPHPNCGQSAIFYDRSFSLDDYLQAQDRIHRISQTNDCYIHNLIASDTVDEWVDVLLTAKYRAAQLAQGDIDTTAFHDSFRDDVSVVLRAVSIP